MKINRFFSILILGVILGVLILSQMARAAVPGLISYTGRLTNAAGTPTTTSQNLIFRIYDGATGGNKLYESSTYSVIPDSGGVFSVLIGSQGDSTGLATAFNNANTYLEVTVGSDTLTPRVQIASAPYSFKAASADTALTVPNGTITSAMIANSTIQRTNIKSGELVKGIVAGTNVSISDTEGGGTGIVTINAAGGGGGAGTVTSVGSGTGLTGGPITTSGTLSLANGGVGTTQLANNSVDLTTKVTGTLPISSGGTGATTQTTGFNALSPLTTKGDIIARDTTNNIRVPVGIDGQILSADSTQTSGLKWVAAGGTGTVTSVGSGTGLTGGPITTTGSLSIANGGVGATQLANSAVDLAGTKVTGTLPIGSGGTGATAKQAAFDTLSPTSAKGDLIANNGTNNVNLTAGTNGQVLSADNTQTTGLKWVAAGGTGTVTSVGSGTGLTGGPITTSGTINVDVGTTANKVVQLNASAQLPAVDGSNLTGLTKTQVGLGNVQNVDTTNASNISSGTLAIAEGGTGQSTQTTSFNALSPLSTKGDIIARDATNNVRVPVGTDGQVLSADSTQTYGLKWVAAGGTGTVTSVGSGTGLTGGPITTTGSLSIANGGVGATQLANSAVDLAGTKVTGTLPIGSGGTGATAKQVAFDALSPTSAKGDLIANNGTNNVNLTVGTNGQVLSADNTQATGLKWVAAGGTGTVTSISQGTGITATPNPITGTGTIAIDTTVVPQLGVVNTFTKADAGNLLIVNQTGAGGILDLQVGGSSKVSVNNSGQIVSTVATGTAPLTVSSTTKVTNLNADLLNDQSASYYTNASNIGAGTLGLAYGGTGQSTQTTAFNALSPLTTKGDIIARDTTNNIRVPVGTDGQILSADSAQSSGLKWVAAGGTGTVTSVGSGTGLTGGPITTTGSLSIANGGVGSTQLAATSVIAAKLGNDVAGTGLTGGNGSALAVDVGTTANKIVQLDGTAKLPAVDGSALTGLTKTQVGLGNVPNVDATNATNISSGTLAIAEGGTGQSTQTAAFNALSPLTTKGDLLATNGTNNIRFAAGTDGQVLSADTTQASGLKWVNSATGTVTSVGSGTGLTGGPIIGSGSLAIDTTVIPQLGATNTFTGANNFTTAGTALSVTNNATIGGTLNANGGISTTAGNLSLSSTGGTVSTSNNISQTGASTLSTGTGAVSLNGNVTVASTKALTVGSGTINSGDTSTNTGKLILFPASANSTTIQPGAAGSALTFTIPTTAGTNGQVLQTNGSGVLSWVTAATGDFKSDGSVAMSGNLNMGTHLINNLGVAGASLTLAGANALTLTTSAATNVTLPTTGTLATLNGTETLANKTLTSPKIGTSILDTNGNSLLLLTATGTAVNQLTLANAATGNNPSFTASGTDTDVGITLTPKGAGTILLGAPAGTGAITVGSSSATQTLNLGTGAGTSNVNIANGLAGNTVAIANGVNTSPQTINIGAGASAANNNINIGSGTNTTGVTAVSIGSGAAQANTLTLDSGTGAITIGNSANARTWNVGAGNAVQTVNMFNNATPANVVKIGGAASTTNIGSVKNTIGSAGTTNGNGVKIGNSRVSTNHPLAFISFNAGGVSPTAAQILDSGIFVCTAAGTLTLPTAVSLVAALPGTPAVGDTITFTIVTTGNFTATLAVSAGMTLRSQATSAARASRVVYCRATNVTSGSEAFDVF